MIAIADDPFPAVDELEALWFAAWGSSAGDHVAKVLPRSLCHAGAYADRRLVGFVNVAWDGGSHAFVIDTLVAAATRRHGIGVELVRVAEREARAAGCEWLHVDFDEHLRGFYLGACGFRPTNAGLIQL